MNISRIIVINGINRINDISRINDINGINRINVVEVNKKKSPAFHNVGDWAKLVDSRPIWRVSGTKIYILLAI